jgi:hypothetical protein
MRGIGAWQVLLVFICLFGGVFGDFFFVCFFVFVVVGDDDDVVVIVVIVDDVVHRFTARFPTPQERKDLLCKFLLDDKWRIDKNFTYQKFLDRSSIFSGDDINRLCATMCRDKIVGVDMPFRCVGSEAFVYLISFL